MEQMTEKREMNLTHDEKSQKAAGIRALEIVIGLLAKGYPKNRIRQYVNECVTYDQYDLLKGAMAEGESFLDGIIGEDAYIQLVQALTKQAAEEQEDGPVIKEDFKPEWAGRAPENATVEIVDKVPDGSPEKAEAGKTTKGAPAKERSGVKTAARTAAAGKKTVAQTRKRATGAADGK